MIHGPFNRLFVLIVVCQIAFHDFVTSTEHNISCITMEIVGANVLFEAHFIKYSEMKDRAFSIRLCWQTPGIFL